MASYETGQRVRDEHGFAGTVRYIGPVATSKDASASWVGVEWDDVTRGKHDGMVTCKDGSSARAYVHLGHAMYTRLGDLGPLPIGYHDKGLTSRPDAHAAIKVCTVAAKLLPADAANQYRLGTLLRRIPGRLQEAIDHFNHCLLANISYPGAKEANEEAVKRMREAQKPRRDWKSLFANLLPALILFAAMTHFLMN